MQRGGGGVKAIPGRRGGVKAKLGWRGGVKAMVLTAGNEINQTGPEFWLCKLKLIAFYLRFITT